MAKKKETTEDNLKDIIKKYGDVVSSGTRVFEKKSNLKSLTVSPSLDIALNGGLKEGTWTVISGDEKTGKTNTCLQIAANAQKEGRPIIYIDGEGRLQSYNLIGVKGLDLEKIQIIHSPEDSILSAEQFLDIAESLIKMPENAGAVCILDSCSSLIPESELTRESSGQIRASLPKLLSHFTKKMNQVIPKQRTIFIIITHYITNTSGYGKVKIPDCGKKIQYQADTKLDIKSSKPWEEAGVKIGNIIEWDIGCSAMGASGTKAISYLRYNHGLDFIQEMLCLGEDFGLISKSGSWYTCSFLESHLSELGDSEWDEKKYKFQGQAKLCEFLTQNENITEILRNDLSGLFR